MKKLLFLDIDGVLNSLTFAVYCNRLHKQNPEKEDREWRPYRDFDPMALSNLCEIIESTGCEIVWSSTWRLGTSVEELNETVEKGMKRWGIDFKIPGIGKTPCLRSELGWGCERGLEIQRWLDENVDEKWGDQVRFCILDDDSDMAHLMGHFVNTDGYTGLTWRDATKVKAILGEIKPYKNTWEDNGFFVKFPCSEMDSEIATVLGVHSAGQGFYMSYGFGTIEEAKKWVSDRGLDSYKISQFNTSPSVVVEDGKVLK